MRLLLLLLLCVLGELDVFVCGGGSEGPKRKSLRFLSTPLGGSGVGV